MSLGEISRNMCLTYVFIRFAITYLFLNCVAYCNPKEHAVTTLIKAKWGLPPPSLEIAEYLADEHNNLFWDFVDALSNLEILLPNLENDFQRYTESMNAVRYFVNPSQIPLIKLALSMHNYSPRLQAHFQIAKEVLIESDCRTSVFATLDEKVICSLEQLKALLKISKKGSFETYSFDHIYPGTQNNSVAIVLYGQIGSEEFNDFHNYLKQNIFSNNIKYVVRHYLQDIQSHKIYLSGYGVELHLKSTEYKSHDDSPTKADKQEHNFYEPTEIEIQGYSFCTLKRNFPHLAHAIDRLRDNLLEKSQEIEPLKAWEFQELGLQAAQRIIEIGGEESLHALEFTAQNFPTQAKSLVHQNVPENFKMEMKHNTDVFARYLNLQPPDSALFINGIYFDGDVIDLNSVLETLRMELKILNGLQEINLKGRLAASLLTLDLQIATTKGFAIDIRDSAVTWINDIENDVQYSRWSSNIMDLTRPTFPGMMRSIRRNLFNLILVVDVIQPNSRNLVRLAESFVQHLAPIRLGIVFDQTRANKTNAANYRTMLCALNYIVQNQSPRFALGFLTDVFASVEPLETIRHRDVIALFKKTFTHLSLEEIKNIFGEDSNFDYGIQLASKFLERLGHNNSPQALMNGVPIHQSLLNVDDFEEAILSETMQQTRSLQDAVYRGELTDADVVIDYLMNQPHVMPRLNQRILSTKDSKYVDFSGTPHNDINDVIALAKLSNRDITATVFYNLKYLMNQRSDKIRGRSVHLMTLWIVADLDTEQGRKLLQKALLYTKTVGRARIAFIPNAGKTKMLSKHNINRIVWTVMQNLRDDEDASMVFDLLSNYDYNETFIVPNKTRAALFKTEPHVQLFRSFCQNVIGVKESENLLIANGRIYGPLYPDEQLTTDDFNLLDRLIKYQYVDKIKDVLNADSNEEDWSPNSDVILKLITTLVPHQRSQIRFNIPAVLQDVYTVIKVPPKKSELFFDVVAFVDPASRGAQKLAPILVLLRNVINCNMRIYFCAVDKHSDMPIKNFYRFVVHPEMQFDYDGKILTGPKAKFIGLPTKPLLTQNLQVPENWLVEVVSSVYDLDNINLLDIGGPVHSEYELEFLLLEGHCFDSQSGAPPRGLQITLGTNQQTVIVDTTVMANLGYFQLKANPGVWKLRLRQGKSADMFDITNVEGPNAVHKQNATIIVISSLNSQVIKLRVTKKPHMSVRDLLDDDDEVQSGIWGSITRSFVGRNEDDGSDDINIFSVASGHLYERLLRIMMLSLLKHTKSSVKFWFLKNYLSPHFIEFLPHMAVEYGFKFELVQYKWPRWLHQQREKQRTIWGYKILFLDVLFPLDVKKIIFVDADAIVRTDIKELNNMDLNGAPYAYTPFCDSRQDMEGFRFWKQGYWKNHLMGRKYHISALYVVDLKKFRKVAAGDRLRGQYQALSQDPNSLSNLDQDLPNNMIHQVAIKSLPEEWLWCQTWCSDESFVNAKVIDLCNNPMTKEAKLAAAQRIVPEWKDYDLEIKRLISRVEDHEMEYDEKSTKAKSGRRNELSERSKHSEL